MGIPTLHKPDDAYSFIGKHCFFIDKVTRQKIYDKRPLGVCTTEGVHSTNKLKIVWFEKPFLGFTWQYKTDVTTCKSINKKQ